jgi:hypothetical protein
MLCYASVAHPIGFNSLYSKHKVLALNSCKIKRSLKQLVKVAHAHHMPFLRKVDIVDEHKAAKLLALLQTQYWGSKGSRSSSRSSSSSCDSRISAGGAASGRLCSSRQRAAAVPNSKCSRTRSPSGTQCKGNSRRRISDAVSNNMRPE